MDAPTRKVEQLVRGGMLAAYFPELLPEREPQFLPIDRRCSVCNVDRPECADPFCARKPEEES